MYRNNKVEMYKDGKVVGVLEPYVAIYIDLINLIMVSIILLIMLLLLLLLLNARELMIIPQCHGISVWDIFLGT